MSRQLFLVDGSHFDLPLSLQMLLSLSLHIVEFLGQFGRVIGLYKLAIHLLDPGTQLGIFLYFCQRLLELIVIIVLLLVVRHHGSNSADIALSLDRSPQTLQFIDGSLDGPSQFLEMVILLLNRSG